MRTGLLAECRAKARQSSTAKDSIDHMPVPDIGMTVMWVGRQMWLQLPLLLFS